MKTIDELTNSNVTRRIGNYSIEVSDSGTRELYFYNEMLVRFNPFIRKAYIPLWEDIIYKSQSTTKARNYCLMSLGESGYEFVGKDYKFP